MKKVIIIGGGFAGLNAAKALSQADVEILLIDRANHHLFQPLLYQVATAALSPDHIASPLRHILSDQKNVRVLLADVVSIDKVKQEIITRDGDRFVFDRLIVAPGARHSYFGRPEWEKLAPGLKTMDDALLIREKILLSFEQAELARSEEEAEKFLRFIIVGAGPTGVEMAGAIAEIARQSLKKNFRKIKPECAKIYLIEGGPEILPSFPKALAEKARHDLENLGVEVLLNHCVTNVTDEGVQLKERFLAAPTVIWAAGNAASPLLQSLDTELDRCGRAIVEKDLSIPNYPHIFVLGDAAHALNKAGKALPGVAPVALQQGRYVARLIAKDLPIHERKPFSYFDKGSMATIGKTKAIAVMKKFQISGFVAWLAWCFVHIAYLVSFTNRLHVLMQWLHLFFLNKRRSRIIIRPTKVFQKVVTT